MSFKKEIKNLKNKVYFLEKSKDHWKKQFREVKEEHRHKEKAFIFVIQV